MTPPTQTPRIEGRAPIAALLEAGRSAVLAELIARLEAAGYADIRPTHGCVFRFVREDGMRLTELAELARITKQSAGEIVSDLEELGYVERVPDPTDGRAKLVRLTARGRDAQRTAFLTFAEIEAGWAKRFGRERVAAMRETLEAIASAEAPELFGAGEKAA